LLVWFARCCHSCVLALKFGGLYNHSLTASLVSMACSLIIDLFKAVGHHLRGLSHVAHTLPPLLCLLLPRCVLPRVVAVMFPLMSFPPLIHMLPLMLPVEQLSVSSNVLHCWPSNVFPCPPMSSCVLRCPPMSSNVFPCPPMSSNVVKCSTFPCPPTSSHVRRGPPMSSHVLLCPPMSSHVLQCPPMPSNVLQCRQIFNLPTSSHVLPPPPMSSHVLPCPPMSSYVLRCPPMSSNVLPCPPMSSNAVKCYPMSSHVR